MTKFGERRGNRIHLKKVGFQTSFANIKEILHTPRHVSEVYIYRFGCSWKPREKHYIPKSSNRIFPTPECSGRGHDVRRVARPEATRRLNRLKSYMQQLAFCCSTPALQTSRQAKRQKETKAATNQINRL